MFDFRPEIDDVTIISCVGRARKMLRVWKCLLFADKKLKTSQPFVVNDDQEICFKCGHGCFLATVNLLRHNGFLWSPNRKDILRLAMFAFCRPGIDDVTIISCGGRTGRISRVWQCLLHVDQEFVTSQSFLLDDEQELMTSQSFLVEAEHERYLSLVVFDFYRPAIDRVTITG